MEENFNPVARTRANYYTPGSPVQFVCVELLKGDVSGEHAVCLTFKNISKVTLTALEIHFKCKGVDGVILCEDRFEYRDLEVKPGELFGMDDAVFVTAKAITSVDVSLCNVYNGKRVVHLDGIKRVRLPAPKRLSAELEKALETRMNRPELKYQPQVFENGWYCACGAFHPNEENTTVCSECGGDRAGIKATLTAILEEARQAAERQQQEVNAVASSVAPAPAPAPQPQAQPAPAASDPRAMANAVQAAITGQQDIPPQSAYEPEQATAAFEPQGSSYADDDEDAEAERVRRYAPKGRLFDDDEDDDEGTQMYDTDDLDYDDEDNGYDKKSKKRGRYADDDETSEDDVMAERIIHLAPPITAIVCALIVALSLVYHFVLA